MKRTYQIFVASTAAHHAQARRIVVEHVIDMGHAAVDMAGFDSAEPAHWAYICKKLIGCDYYVALLAAGSAPEVVAARRRCRREVEQAQAAGLPIMALLLGEGADAAEEAPSPSEAGAAAEAREIAAVTAQGVHYTVRDWRDVSEFGFKVTAALAQMMRETPRLGWIRGPKFEAEAEAVVPPELVAAASEAAEPPTAEAPAPDGEVLPALAAELQGVAIEVGSFRSNQYVANKINLLDVFSNTHYSFLSGLSSMDFLLLIMEHYNGRMVKPDENRLLSELMARDLIEARLPQRATAGRSTSETMFVLTETGKDFAAFTHMMRLRENMDHHYGPESD